MRRVVVQIDSLVLKGFRYGDRNAIAAGLQEEMSRLFESAKMSQRLAQGGEVPCLRVGNVHIAASATPKQIGIAAAQGIGKGLNR